MKQLFKTLVASETGASIDKHGDVLVAKYKKHGKAKQILAAEEIQALIDERDDALRKVVIGHCTCQQTGLTFLVSFTTSAL